VAHNEEKKLEDCLRSLNFVDEIVVVLDKCSDKSKEIALKFTDKIIEGSWDIEGARRNVALIAASCDWILEIDADERITRELADEIKCEIKTSEPCGFHIPINNYVGKKFVKYGWLRTIAVSRRQTLFYRGLKKYHEDKQVHPTADFDGKFKSLKNAIIHLMDDDVSDLLARFNRYTTWKANDIVARGKTFKKRSIFYFIFGFKMRFFKSFFIKKGYKEGALGLLIATLGASYPVVSYLKVAEKINNK
jgi:glycosyltransferase involved in cell wall biosynthesis